MMLKFNAKNLFNGNSHSSETANARRLPLGYSL